MNIQDRPAPLPGLRESQTAPASATEAAGAAAAESTGPQPFDELKLDSPTVEKSIDKLKRKGYFTVRMSQTTKNFLDAQQVEKAPAVYAGKAISFKPTPSEPGPYEAVVTGAATKLMSAINGRETALQTHECEVRWPAGTGASDWHVDSHPKVLTCLTTLSGKPTEFVSLDVARSKFKPTPGRPKDLMPINRDEPTAADIRQAKKDKFYFFAADGVKDDQIPKLVHRAPGEAGRSIFLARWKEKK